MTRLTLFLAAALLMLLGVWWRLPWLTASGGVVLIGLIALWFIDVMEGPTR